MGLASRPTRTQRGLFLLEGAFERPVTKNSELGEVVFTAATSSPTPVSPSGQNTAEALPNVLQGQLRKHEHQEYLQSSQVVFLIL